MHLLELLFDLSIPPGAIKGNLAQSAGVLLCHFQFHQVRLRGVRNPSSAFLQGAFNSTRCD